MSIPSLQEQWCDIIFNTVVATFDLKRLFLLLQLLLHHYSPDRCVCDFERFNETRRKKVYFVNYVEWLEMNDCLLALCYMNFRVRAVRLPVFFHADPLLCRYGKYWKIGNSLLFSHQKSLVTPKKARY